MRLLQDDRRIFVVHNVFSTSECAALVRAAEDDDEGGAELGMSEVAYEAARVLGIPLGPREARFHVPTDVGDLASDSRVRLVLA